MSSSSDSDDLDMEQLHAQNRQAVQRIQNQFAINMEDEEDAGGGQANPF